MKAVNIIAKILAALAAVAGVVYVIATYGDKIVAWAKGLLGKCECCCKCGGKCTCESDEAEACDGECCCAEPAEPAAEEATVEEAPAEEAPVAEENDFEG